MKYTLICLLCMGTAQLSAQDLAQPSDPKATLITLCNALESYRVDFTGYPAMLAALSPVYLQNVQLQGVQYAVQSRDAQQGPEGAVYQRFLLRYYGADHVPNTPDDIIIDTQEVRQQPTGYDLPSVIVEPARMH